MNNLKLKLYMTLSLCFLMIGPSCEPHTEGDPIQPESVSVNDVMRSSLSFLARDLRQKGKTLYDVAAVQESSLLFLKETYSGKTREGAISVFNGLPNSGFGANEENGDYVSLAFENLTIRIDQINDESESLQVYQDKLQGLKTSFTNETMDDEVRFAGIFQIDFNIILGEFYFENPDLFNRSEGTTMNGGGIEVYAGLNGIDGWWSRARAYLKCAAGTIGGGLTGAVVGCGGIGGIGLVVGGPHGAIVGCAIGVVVGGAGGALTGAVASGCFEL